jgi:hypothetical protein
LHARRTSSRVTRSRAFDRPVTDKALIPPDALSAGGPTNPANTKDDGGGVARE